MHRVSDTQDTPARTPPAKAVGLAAGRTVQAPPVHCSASRCLLPCTRLLENPTAVQLAAVGQETAVVMAYIAPGGRGTGRRTQPVAALAAPGQLSWSTAAVSRPIRVLRITPPSFLAGIDWPQATIERRAARRQPRCDGVGLPCAGPDGAGEPLPWLAGPGAWGAGTSSPGKARVPRRHMAARNAAARTARAPNARSAGSACPTSPRYAALRRSSSSVTSATAAAAVCTGNGSSYTAAAATGRAPRAASMAVRV